MDVGEVLRLLGEREAACQAEVDRLQAEAERIGALLAACRVELDRLVTARGVVGELAVPTATTSTAAVDGAVPGGSAVGLEVFTERVLAVLAERGRAVRCQEVVVALGQDATVARHVERVRHRLKKLCRAGLSPRPGRECSPCRVHRVRRRGEHGGVEGSSTSWRRCQSLDRPEEDPMRPYPHSTPGPDDFAASRARLDAMITHLGGVDMMQGRVVNGCGFLSRGPGGFHAASA